MYTYGVPATSVTMPKENIQVMRKDNILENFNLWYAKKLKSLPKGDKSVMNQRRNKKFKSNKKIFRFRGRMVDGGAVTVKSVVTSEVSTTGEVKVNKPTTKVHVKVLKKSPDGQNAWRPTWDASGGSEPTFLTRHLLEMREPCTMDKSTNEFFDCIEPICNRHLYWLALMVVLLILCRIRRNYLATNNDFYNYKATLQSCIAICVVALALAMALELVVHWDILHTLPSISIHPADNGEIDYYVQRLKPHVERITSILAYPYHGNGSEVGVVARGVHRYIDRLIKNNEELVTGYRSAAEAYSIETPLLQSFLTYEWDHFIICITYWAVALFIISILASYEFYFPAILVAAAAVCLAAIVITYKVLGLVEACSNTYLHSRRFAQDMGVPSDEEELRKEYNRLCRSWFAKFELRLEYYEKLYLYSTHEVWNSAHVEGFKIKQQQYTYLKDTSNRLQRVASTELPLIRQTLPPRCNFHFKKPVKPGTYTTLYTSSTNPVPTTNARRDKTLLNTGDTTKYATRPPTTFRPYYERDQLGPLYLPPNDMVLRNLCQRNKKLRLLVIQAVLMMVAGTLAIIFLLCCLVDIKELLKNQLRPRYYSEPCPKSERHIRWRRKKRKCKRKPCKKKKNEDCAEYWAHQLKIRSREGNNRCSSSCSEDSSYEDLDCCKVKRKHKPSNETWSVESIDECKLRDYNQKLNTKQILKSLTLLEEELDRACPSSKSLAKRENMQLSCHDKLKKQSKNQCGPSRKYSVHTASYYRDRRYGDRSKLWRNRVVQSRGSQKSSKISKKCQTKRLSLKQRLMSCNVSDHKQRKCLVISKKTQTEFVSQYPSSQLFHFWHNAQDHNVSSLNVLNSPKLLREIGHQTPFLNAESETKNPYFSPESSSMSFQSISNPPSNSSLPKTKQEPEFKAVFISKTLMSLKESIPPTKQITPKNPDHSGYLTPNYECSNNVSQKYQDKSSGSYTIIKPSKLKTDSLPAIHKGTLRNNLEEHPKINYGEWDYKSIVDLYQEIHSRKNLRSIKETIEREHIPLHSRERKKSETNCKLSRCQSSVWVQTSSVKSSCDAQESSSIITESWRSRNNVKSIVRKIYLKYVTSCGGVKKR